MSAGPGGNPSPDACPPETWAGRRRFLCAALAAAGTGLLMGHMPYRQWYVFRATHLFIVTSATDPGAGELADRIAEALASRLPLSKALAAEAADAREVVQLLRTHQIPVALLKAEEADAAYAGVGDAGQGGAIALRTLAPVGPRLLVVLEDFPGDKAFAIAGALADFTPAQAPGSDDSDRGSDPRVPFHPGALAFHEGRPPPAAR